MELIFLAPIFHRLLYTTQTLVPIIGCAGGKSKGVAGEPKIPRREAFDCFPTGGEIVTGEQVERFAQSALSQYLF